jgi:hypothetical protein
MNMCSKQRVGTHFSLLLEWCCALGLGAKIKPVNKISIIVRRGASEMPEKQHEKQSNSSA